MPTPIRLESGARRRRRRRRLRLIPVALLVALVAVALALVLGGGGGGERDAARAYVRAWARQDYSSMYALLDTASQRSLSEPAFASAYRDAALTATLVALAPGRIGSWRGGVVPVQMVLRTRLFGVLREELAVPVLDTTSGARVQFTPALVFPGLHAGERLSRRLTLPPRAALLFADGTPLAAGPQRTSPLPGTAGAIAGVLRPIPADEARAYAALGYPPGTLVGRDGLERIFQTRLAGTPGGVLLAGARVLAQRAPRPGADVRTTIVPAIETAIIDAMAGRYAGIVALDPRTGAILGAAGIAFSDPQPPGSTMKIVTSTGLLEAHLAKLDDVFPVLTQVDIDGYPLHNASDEACGGTLINAFAVSCNSVFAPLGVRLGARAFLDVAERFGFNGPAPLPGEPASTIPTASVEHSTVELAASAIGQGEVQASVLQMADVAATIAMGGRRPVPTLLATAAPRFVAVTRPTVAADVQRMMIAVVASSDGTGYRAAISGVTVAGKTGTAEIGNTVNPQVSNPANTDAWFVGYAPVGAPRIVVGALFPGQGAGGDTAAPAARTVLEAGLQRP